MPNIIAVAKLSFPLAGPWKIMALLGLVLFISNKYELH